MRRSFPLNANNHFPYLISLSCLSQLLQHGANMHILNRSADGGTALHEAVANEHASVVDLLLRHGASPFCENVKGTRYALSTQFTRKAN